MKRCRMLYLMMASLFLSVQLWAAPDDGGRNPNNPLDQGGETCATAVAITSIPFCDTGTTSGRLNDYPVPCADNSNARDVVYSITPPVTTVLSFSLCGSSYNSALTIWRGCPSSGGVLVCCSDNVCADDACCSGVTLVGNTTYFIVVDGGITANNFGDYILNVVAGTECPSTPCAQDTCQYPNHDVEPNNLCAGGGGVITCGDTLCGVVEPNGHDYYYLDIFGPGCQNVTINVFGNDTPGEFPFGQGLNPSVYIYSTNCVDLLAADGNSGIGNDALLDSVCLRPGLYRVLISGDSIDNNSGPYIVTLNCTPCHCPDTCNYENRDNEAVNNTCGTFNPPFVCGDTLCGEISAVNDVDWYLITVVGPGLVRVKIDVFGDDTPGYYPFGQGLDPMVRLVGVGCSSILGVDTASGIGEDASLEVCVPQGTYNIQVQQEDFTSGPYILATHCEPCDTCPYPNRDLEPINNQCGTINPQLECGSAVCGEIENTSGPDEDWYLIQITECTQFFIDALGDDTPGFYPFGGGLNTALELWTADCQTPLYLDFNSGQGEDAQLTTPCLPAGIYMLRVYGELATEGPYILFIGCESCSCEPPCPIVCPQDAREEGEPCPAVIDTTNGGCDSDPHAFLPFGCDVLYCGTSWANGLNYDTDWYRFILTEPRQVRICMNTEFSSYLNLFAAGPGTDGCESTDLIECAPIYSCEGTQCISACLPPGRYYVSVIPQPGILFSCWQYWLGMVCAPCEPAVCEAPDSLLIHYPDSNGTGNIYEDAVLYWPPVPGADEYRIYRTSNNNSTNIVTPANFIASTTDTFFVHDNILFFGADEIYIYQVVAYCRYDYPPCDQVPTSAIKPVSPDILIPKE
jgi:hypothetical protein